MSDFESVFYLHCLNGWLIYMCVYVCVCVYVCMYVCVCVCVGWGCVGCGGGVGVGGWVSVTVFVCSFACAYVRIFMNSLFYLHSIDVSADIRTRCELDI